MARNILDVVAEDMGSVGPAPGQPPVATTLDESAALLAPYAEQGLLANFGWNKALNNVYEDVVVGGEDPTRTERVLVDIDPAFKKFLTDNNISAARGAGPNELTITAFKDGAQIFEKTEPRGRDLLGEYLGIVGSVAGGAVASAIAPTIASSLQVSAQVANVIANAAVQATSQLAATGRIDPETIALQAVASVVAPTVGQNVAQSVNDAVVSLTGSGLDPATLASVNAAATSASATAIKGGEPSDVLNNAVAGAVATSLQTVDPQLARAVGTYIATGNVTTAIIAGVTTQAAKDAPNEAKQAANVTDADIEADATQQLLASAQQFAAPFGEQATPTTPEELEMFLNRALQESGGEPVAGLPLAAAAAASRVIPVAAEYAAPAVARFAANNPQFVNLLANSANPLAQRLLSSLAAAGIITLPASTETAVDTGDETARLAARFPAGGATTAETTAEEPIQRFEIIGQREALPVTAEQADITPSIFDIIRADQQAGGGEAATQTAAETQVGQAATQTGQTAATTTQENVDAAVQQLIQSGAGLDTVTSAAGLDVTTPVGTQLTDIVQAPAPAPVATTAAAPATALATAPAPAPAPTTVTAPAAAPAPAPALATEIATAPATQAVAEPAVQTRTATAAEPVGIPPAPPPPVLTGPLDIEPTQLITGEGEPDVMDQQIMDLIGIAPTPSPAAEPEPEMEPEAEPAPPPPPPAPAPAPSADVEGAPVREQARPTPSTPLQVFTSVGRRPTRPAPRPILREPTISSGITQGLGGVRSPGEIESEVTGQRRRNVWNEASLRLKDALGI